MNKTLMSFLKASALAIALYACTEDAERLQQSDDAMSMATAAANTTATTELSKRKFTPDVGGAILLADASTKKEAAFKQSCKSNCVTRTYANDYLGSNTSFSTTHHPTSKRHQS